MASFKMLNTIGLDGSPMRFLRLCANDRELCQRLKTGYQGFLRNVRILYVTVDRIKVPSSFLHGVTGCEYAPVRWPVPIPNPKIAPIMAHPRTHERLCRSEDSQRDIEALLPVRVVRDNGADAALEASVEAAETFASELPVLVGRFRCRFFPISRDVLLPLM